MSFNPHPRAGVNPRTIRDMISAKSFNPHPRAGVNYHH